MRRGGRVGRIVKPAGPSAARSRIVRGAGGGPGAGNGATPNLTAHDGQSILDADADADADAVADVSYADLPLSNEQYAAAAAASAALQANIAEHEAIKEDSELVEDESAVDPDLDHHPEHLDLNAAANILANGNAAGQDLSAMQQHLHHHSQAHVSLVQGSQQQLGQGHAVDPTLTKSTDTLAVESGYVSLNVESQLAKRLAAWPGLRLAQQRRPEQQLNLQRRSNVEALFAHIAGKLAKVQCKNCHKGHGPWNSCVIVEGQMCGSCANCWFNASGARCSFHETRQNVIPAGTASHGHVVDPNGHAYAVPQQMLGTQHTTRLGTMGINVSPLTNDPTLRYNIERAINEVRAADERARHLISIDVAAKQLALQIVAYEDFVADTQGQQVQHQQVAQVQQIQQAAQVPQPNMGDDSTA